MGMMQKTGIKQVFFPNRERNWFGIVSLHWQERFLRFSVTFWRVFWTVSIFFLLKSRRFGSWLSTSSGAWEVKNLQLGRLTFLGQGYATSCAKGPNGVAFFTGCSAVWLRSCSLVDICERFWRNCCCHVYSEDGRIRQVPPQPKNSATHPRR